MSATPDGKPFTFGAQARDPNVDKKADITKAILESVLTELREELKVLEQDSWMYQAPRHTYF